MLLVHSPNLQELTFDALSTRYIDLNPMYGGLWPNLRSLRLGDYVLQDGTPGLSPHTIDSPLMAFLVAHPNLKSLMLHGVNGWYFPRELELPSSALPQLSYFSGTIWHAEFLPNPSLLKSLRLTSRPYHVNDIPDMCYILRSLQSLTSLDIWLECDPKIFSTLILACPRLLHLEVFCSSPPPFDMVSFQDSDSPCHVPFSPTFARNPSWLHFTTPHSLNRLLSPNCANLVRVI